MYGISYALFGIDTMSGYVLASRAPVDAWEPGAYLTREVQFPEETRTWFASPETRPLLIMTGQGLGLECRHLTLAMTTLSDPAVDAQMSLRSSATELFRF